MRRTSRVEREEEVRRYWAQRGLALTEGRIEEVDAYDTPILVAPGLEPAELVTAWRRQLESAGFHAVDVGDVTEEEAGLTPGLVTLHGGAAARRGGELVLCYAMRGGLPEADGRVPCRGALFSCTSELHGPWLGRGLEKVGHVVRASSMGIEIQPTGDLEEAFAETQDALVASGARIASNAAENARALAAQVRALMEMAAADGETTPPDADDWLAANLHAMPSAVTLDDRDGATLRVEMYPSVGTIRVTRAVPEDDALDDEPAVPR